MNRIAANKMPVPYRVLFFGLCLSVVLAGLAWAQIEGSKHDFSNREWSGDDACGACHATQSEPPKAAPLWNPGADLNRTFGQPLAQSKRAGLGTTMCLRCHDGTIARATLTPEPRDRFVSKENPGLFGASHSGRDHPVGVDYPKFDREFRPEPIVISGGAVTLPNGKVECISCHDPHNMTGEPYFLVTSNARSALCLTCHQK